MAQAKRAKRRVATKATARKTATTRRRRSPRHSKSFMGLPGLKGGTAKIFDLLKKGGLTIMGFMVGREIERKVIKDAEGFKKFIGPLGQLGGGYLLAQMNGDIPKYIGYGLVGGGIISGVGKVFGKDFVSSGILNGIGLNGLGDLRQLISGPYDSPETQNLRLPQFSTENFQGDLAGEGETIDTPVVFV